MTLSSALLKQKLLNMTSVEYAIITSQVPGVWLPAHHGACWSSLQLSSILPMQGQNN